MIGFVSAFPGPYRPNRTRKSTVPAARTVTLHLSAQEAAWLAAAVAANGRCTAATLRDCLRECRALTELGGFGVLVPQEG